MTDPPSKSIRAAIYTRVSTDRKGQDPQNQLTALRELANREKLLIISEFVEHETGTGKRRRAEFERMLADAEQRKFDVLLIWALDRFSREGALKTLQLIEKLSKLGIKVRSHCESWLDPSAPTYELLLPIFAWIARQESIRISERVRAGLQTAVANGKKLGRRPKHGDQAAEILKQILEMHAAGKSHREISKVVGLSRSRISQIIKAAKKKRNAS